MIRLDFESHLEPRSQKVKKTLEEAAKWPTWCVAGPDGDGELTNMTLRPYDWPLGRGLAQLVLACGVASWLLPACLIDDRAVRYEVNQASIRGNTLPV
jgi:hypothetical protein